MTTLDRHVGSIEVTLDLEFGLSDLNDLCSSVGVGSILLYLTILGIDDLNNLCSSVDPASLLLYLTNLARKRRRTHIPSIDSLGAMSLTRKNNWFNFVPRRDLAYNQIHPNWRLLARRLRL